jgi:serine protease SohB
MFAEYLLFFAKVITFVIAIIVVFAAIFALASKEKGKTKDKLKVKNLNEKFKNMEKTLLEHVTNKKQLKSLRKSQKKSEKASKSNQTAPRRKIFVLNFHGDIRASAIKHLREEITAVLTTANTSDEVVLRLESGGGMVHAYGLAASQLQRLRKKQIPLTIIIDKVAASGGYMMAAVGNKILAAPFAVIGSIGVLAQLPNFNGLLKKNDIEFEQIMAGQYKRTLTVFGENTQQGREKMQEEVNTTHALFKEFIMANRPIVNIESVATGEHWYGNQALQLQLIDDILTSDDYLLSASQDADIYEVCFTPKKNLLDKFTNESTKVMENLFDTIWSRLSNSR